MRYLLDTNVCVDYLRGRFPSVVQRIHATSPDDLCVSSIVVAELRYGAHKSAKPEQNNQLLDRFLTEMTCVEFDLDAADLYGELRTGLEGRGEVIGPNDLLIAAHALSLGVVLVSDNLREFSRVPGLIVENWRE